MRCWAGHGAPQHDGALWATAFFVCCCVCFEQAGGASVAHTHAYVRVCAACLRIILCCLETYYMQDILSCLQGAAEARFGANRWDAAEFSSEQERQKFIKLMASATFSPEPGVLFSLSCLLYVSVTGAACMVGRAE